MNATESQVLPASPIRVLTVDDHPIFRHGVRHLLETEDDLDPVAEVASIEEALDWIGGRHAHVVLVDHNLPGTKGIPGIRLLLERQPDLQAIVLTVCDSDREFLEAIRNGACGYVLKDAPPERLLDAIRAAANGECRVSEKMIATLFKRVSGEPRPAPDAAGAADDEPAKEVTPREQELLRCLCSGFSNKEIATELGLSPNTVRNQLQRLQERLSARNRVQLALLARDMGYTEAVV
jgi:two-component system nitrate/nitrite response regulator NarL